MQQTPILSLQGKSWESKQSECEVSTVIHKHCMWSASDQPWERLSARGTDEWEGSFEILGIHKRIEADMPKSVVRTTNILMQVLE